MNAEQIERVRVIVQEIATDESIAFDEAFSVAMDHLKYWADEMPKGRQFSGGGKFQAVGSQADHVSD
ncbi:hypothetical protein [Pseudomonas aeruginosa]|uniref:hypothetical protein n=1 Tax=Pseudomonas aeruginosa TaxID=287 RepID=UPI00053D3F0F|nr:hypothetical protein [Pseudomonas aeruginosa]KSI59930.1 hypothetical protein AO985_05160 [Pseudomonas aeruginosa]MBW1097288.1 hypothetical protein [Pseudomonas aeruginosa]MDG3878351.1 hypothetical protein [Pseudomonas aeruginosa]QPZ62491.1 hypothetical protein I9X26_14305 [Pseudomonas aeruginosa]WCV51663.1 hypothetical protein KKY57_13055 [Pseudomonas aeruginosa]